jgi:hypothetical protein
MKKTLAYALAAIALFVWGFLFWGLLSEPLGMYRVAADEGALGAELSEALGEDGVYFLPAETSDDAAWVARHTAGPLAMIHFRRGGADPRALGTFLAGFLHMLVSAILIAWLVQAAPAGRRMSTVVLAALAAAVFANLGTPIWMYQSWRYHELVAGYQFVGWLVAGAILAKMLPERS